MTIPGPFRRGGRSGVLGKSICARACLFGLWILGCAPVEPRSAAERASTDSESFSTQTPPGADDWFVEVQDQVGLDFRHVHGGSGERYMVETMAGGGGWIDFDNDNHLDIYFVQSGPLPGFPDSTPLPNRLYRNRGDGTFEDVTEGSGAGDLGYGIGTCFGDIDNDGWIDIYVTNLGRDTLLRNRGRGIDGRVTFEDVTSEAGIDNPLFATGCAFADYDGDGDLDLYVVDFVDFSIETHRPCGAPELRTYCSPDAYNGVPDRLYRNRGDGTFEDVAVQSGIRDDDPQQGKGLSVLWTDYDDDGDPDAYVANDSTRNFLFRNQHGGSFEEVAIVSGVAFNDQGLTEASMGLAAGDADGDGRFDLFMTHLDFETNTFYRGQAENLFLDLTATVGLAGPSVTKVGFGTNFLDYDHDGDLDLFVANGHIVDNIELRNPSLRYAQTNQLFENRGGRFEDVSASAGSHFAHAQVSRASAAGDFDNDGDLDLLIVNSNDRATILRNRRGSSARGGHWLMLRLVSRYGGRDAIGARVRVVAGGRSWVEEVRSGGSYLSQGDLRLHFGLGELTTVDRLEIRWPEGGTQVVPGREVAVDTIQTITQNEDLP